MRELIASVGRIGTVLAITVISVLSSLAVCSLIYVLLDLHINFQTILLAIIPPLVIAPAISWYVVTLLINVHHLELKMRHHAIHDALTGILNRGAFVEQCSHYLQLARR